ncbi:hypothetical protein, partial [Burkholderia glumae]|uniref:hypothetical protein n=1 Tax=Burkholderia glumae TaxID=337 RepID=UPI0019D6D2D4
ARRTAATRRGAPAAIRSIPYRCVLATIACASARLFFVPYRRDLMMRPRRPRQRRATRIRTPSRPDTTDTVNEKKRDRS